MYHASPNVIDVHDGTRGRVLNGYASDGHTRTAYAVETEYGFENWPTSHMLVSP